MHNWTKNLLVVSAIIVAVLAVCPGPKWQALVDCINGSVQSEWQALQSDPNGKLQKDENQMKSCIRNSGCSVNVDFTSDWINKLDGQLQPLAQDIRTFWNSASREIQQCILAEARDKFLGQITQCVNQNGGSISLPAHLGQFPVPPAALYANRDQKSPLNRYIDDRINALLSTKDCSSDQRHKVVLCMKGDGDAALKNCIRSNICSDPGCKADFPGTCKLFVQCIPIVLKQAAQQLTSLSSGSSTGALQFLSNCGGSYSRVAAIKVYEGVVKVAKAGLSDKFNGLLKDLMEAYVTAEGFCENVC